MADDTPDSLIPSGGNPSKELVEQEPLAASSITLSGEGVIATVPKNTTYNIDLKLTEDKIIQGGYLFNKNSVWGDWLSFQVVDVDNVLGYGAGVVLDTFIVKWYVNSEHGQAMKVSTKQGKTIPANIYIRCEYHSVGTVNDVEVAINYILSKSTV